MLIVIPISPADVHMCEWMLHALRYCSFNKKSHNAIIVGPPSMSTPITEFLRYSYGWWHNIDMYTFKEEPPVGWPIGCNHYFREVAKRLGKWNRKGPWYYFELDNTPIKTGWADILEDEYNKAGKLYMGVKNVTRPGDYVNGDTTDYGHHMVGTGIYPNGFSKLCHGWQDVDEIPWDFKIQDQVVPHLHDTKLIQHNWYTSNYRMEEGRIVCDRKNDPTYKGTVSDEAVVVHGCKDGSLIHLLNNNSKSSGILGPWRGSLNSKVKVRHR